MLDDTFLFGVTVEPDDRAQPAGNRGAGLTAVFEVAGEALDVDTADVEQAVIVSPAPGALDLRQFTARNPSNVIRSTSESTG